jgi:hypothetical protein
MFIFENDLGAEGVHDSMELSFVLYFLIYVAPVMRDYEIIFFASGKSCHL